jgi:O-acetyl-ADP-ribose deacetylase (regulator of RNase III)
MPIPRPEDDSYLPEEYMSWLDRLDVEAVQGDILECEVEALGCAIRTDLQAYGRISQALYTRCGVELEHDLQEVTEGGRLPLGHAVTLPAHPRYNLPDTVQHLILAAYWDHASEYSLNLVYRTLAAMLRQSFACGASSLALPMLSSERRGLIFTAGVEVIREFDMLRNSGSFPTEYIVYCSTSCQDVELMDAALTRGLSR